MIRGRAETDTKYPAGQYTHGPARPSTASRSVLKLGDYVDQVKASEERTERLISSKKFSFDEWLILKEFKITNDSDANLYYRMREAWNAGQENK